MDLAVELDKVFAKLSRDARLRGAVGGGMVKGSTAVSDFHQRPRVYREKGDDVLPDTKTMNMNLLCVLHDL